GLVRRASLRGHGARGLRLRHAGDLDQAHAAIPGARQPLVEAEARNLGARGLAGLEQRVLRRDIDFPAVDDELGHIAFTCCSLELYTFVSRRLTRFLRSSMSFLMLSARTCAWLASPSAVTIPSLISSSCCS